MIIIIGAYYDFCSYENKCFLFATDCSRMLSGGRIEKQLLILHENFQQNQAILELFKLNFKIKGIFSSQCEQYLHLYPL